MGEIAELWGQVEVNRLFEEDSDSSEMSEDILAIEKPINRRYSDKPQIMVTDEQQIPTYRVKSLKITSKAKLKMPVRRGSDATLIGYPKKDDDAEDIYDEVEDTDVNEEQIPRHTALLELLTPRADSEKVKRLRAISGGKRDLHCMLEKDSSSINSNMLIDVLQVSLRGETKKIKDLKNQKDFIQGRLKTEIMERENLQAELKKTKQAIRSSSLAEGVSGMEKFVVGAVDEKKLHEFIENRKKKLVKWCEINFNDIHPENSPYQYSSYGIWYKAKWNYTHVRLCVAIGGIQRDMIESFRECSARIQ